MKKVGQLFREKLVNKAKDGVANNSSLFVLTYDGFSNNAINDLRKNLHKAGANVTVFKKSLAKIALSDLEYSKLSEGMDGQVAFIWSNKDAVEISKILLEFVEKSEGVEVTGGILEKQILDKLKVEELSKLPSREVLLSMLLATIQAPVSRFMGALNAKTRELLSILKQLSEKKGGN